MSKTTNRSCRRNGRCEQKVRKANFRPIVGPTAHLPVIVAAKVLEGGTIGA